MSEGLQVKRRDTRGTSAAKRMRAAGATPAVLYGHGQETLSLSVPTDQLEAAMRHGARVVSLTGDVVDSALIREVQWDTFGAEVLHVDLTRVSLSEMVELSVPLELRGEAPGLRQGGVVEQPLHELELECPVSSLTDKLVVSINQLELGDSITAGDVELPKGAKLVTPADTLVVHCIEKVEMEEEEAGGATGAEPEVIGRKEEDEEGGD